MKHEQKKQARIGHFVEAQILESIEVDYIDESEVLTMADEDNHINKRKFQVPFVCGCRNLGEALVSVLAGRALQYACVPHACTLPRLVVAFCWVLFRPLVGWPAVSRTKRVGLMR